MSCSSCGTGGGCSTGGCNSNGGCGSGGCNKLNVFDWLGNMDDAILPSERMNIVEIRFKGGRKEFFKNTQHLVLHTGDPVVVEVPSGHHLGFVSLQGELVRLQMKKKNIVDDENVKAIYRIANDKDLERYELSKMREMGTLFRTRQIADELKLQMKLSDIEYQADNAKATFFYSADDRVDFRELIKCLASEFKIRVEMKQISLRQEASRLGGIGVCGRELCCSTWLSDFKNVSTTAARYQNLSLNPAKLSGQCGRLKCCLNYELETYMDALKGIPTIEAPLLTEKGASYLQKTDIFRRIMWFSYQGETAWYPLTIEQVLKVVDLNEKGIKPESLNPDDLVEEKAVVEFKPINDDLARLDKKYSATKSKRKKKKSTGNGNTITPTTGENAEPKPAIVANKQAPIQANKPAAAPQGNQANRPSAAPQKNQNQNQNSKPNQPKPQQDNRNQQNAAKPSAPPRQAVNPAPAKPSAIVPRKNDAGTNPPKNNNDGTAPATPMFTPRTPIKPN